MGKHKQVVCDTSITTRRSWQNGCGFRGDVGSCRMWVTPRDFPLSFSGLPLTLLVSCGERIGPIFLDVCAGCSLESLQHWGIFSGSWSGGAFASCCVTHSVWTSRPCSSVPLILPIQPAQKQSSHISYGHFFLNRTSQVGGNVPNRAGCHDSCCRGTVGAMPGMPWILHPSVCQYSVFHVTVS